MKMRNTKQRFLSRVGCFLILLLFLLGASVTATTLTVAIPMGSQTEWSTVVERYAKAHPTVDVQLLEFSPSELRNRIVLDCVAAAGQFDVVTIRREWVDELADCLQDLSASVGKLESAGSVPVLCDGKVLGGEWLNKSDWAVCVSKQSKNLDHAVALLLAATQGATPSVRFLTQNTALLPGWPVKLVGLCVDKTQRIPCIRDLIGSYDIVGLQEIFDEYCQYIIVNSWPGKREVMIDLKAEQQNILKKRKPVMTMNYLKGALVAGRIIDARPNTIESYIVYDRYFVMGPDSDLTVGIAPLNWFNVKRQDGGLLILTQKDYPIIAASGFVFKDTAPLELRSWDAASSKGALYARIQVGPSEEDYIHVFNTHLQAHDFPAVRKKQLEELEEFIHNATSDRWFFSAGAPVEIPSSKGEYDGHPIVLLGDFNIIASSTAGKPPQKTPTPEYKDLLKALPQQLVDAWDEKNPSQEGHTWIGMDQITPSSSPWWVLGNVVAIEKGGGQRIDYFFYNAGTSKLSINPTSVSLVPRGPQTVYCFDKKSADWWGCIKATVPQSKADIKVGEIHALVISSLMVGVHDKVEGIAQLGAFKIYIDPKWETPKFKIGDVVLAKIFAMTAIDTAVAGEYKAPWMKKRCTLMSHTVSDHLGVEIRFDIVFP